MERNAICNALYNAMHTHITIITWIHMSPRAHPSSGHGQRRMPHCKTYAAVAVLQSESDHKSDNATVITDIEENQLVLAVPGACSNGDVAFRLLPLLIQKLVSTRLNLRAIFAHI